MKLRKEKILLYGLCAIIIGNAGCTWNTTVRDRVYKETGSYLAIRHWHMLYLNSHSVADLSSNGSKTICVPDAFSYHDASLAFAVGFNRGGVKQGRVSDCCREWLDSYDIISHAYADGMMQGVCASLRPPDYRKCWQMYFLYKSRIDELDAMYWSDPLAVKLADATSTPNETVGHLSLTGLVDLDADAGPAVNPYESLWVSYSNSYVRTVYVLKATRGENVLTGQVDAAMMTIEASAIPEYRAYTYGYWQALLDCASSFGGRYSQLQFKLEQLKRIERTQYLYIKERMKETSPKGVEPSFAKFD